MMINSWSSKYKQLLVSYAFNKLVQSYAALSAGREYCIVVKGMDFGARRLSFNSQLNHLLINYMTLAIYFIFLCLNFFTCRDGIITVPTNLGFMRSKCVNLKYLEECLAHRKYSIGLAYQYIIIIIIIIVTITYFVGFSCNKSQLRSECSGLTIVFP